MKVAIGMNLREAPFGGGNQFGLQLREYLVARGHQVVDNLNSDGLDVILMTEPRKFLRSSSFGPVEIHHYLRSNPNTLVFHRVNECDERKGTRYVNRYLTRANNVADHTVFISQWLKSLFLNQKSSAFWPYSVILNGGDRRNFRYTARKPPANKIKLVTHHWSPNPMKGWDLYEAIDHNLASTELGEKYEFHYVGNVPEGFKAKVMRIHKPSHGTDLAEILNECHIYITGSQNEPAGMHHIEGCLLGLPIVFRKSGALPEYCTPYGVGFDDVDSFWRALADVEAAYETFAERLEGYERGMEEMCSEYHTLFLRSIEEKEKLIQSRPRKSLVQYELNLLSFKIYDLFLSGSSALTRVLAPFEMSFTRQRSKK